jgi:hypothetical protein
MQEILDRYKTGILISKVTMQNAQPPEQVQAAFDDAVKASQDRERQKNEGQAYANDVIPRARGTASRLFEESEGYKQRVIATAEGDASRFTQIYTEYAKAPEVTRSRMYLDTMQEVYANTSKVLVDSKGQGNLLYLPLDKLMQAAGAVAAAPGGSPAAAGGAWCRLVRRQFPTRCRHRSQMSEGRSRETLRSVTGGPLMRSMNVFAASWWRAGCARVRRFLPLISASTPLFSSWVKCVRSSTSRVCISSGR